MSLLDLFQLRKEMQKRTDQIIKCSHDWLTGAKELTDALNRVADAIGNNDDVDQNTVKKINNIARILGKDTKKLTTGLGRHEKSMIRFGKMISDES